MDMDGKHRIGIQVGGQIQEFGIWGHCIAVGCWVDGSVFLRNRRIIALSVVSGLNKSMVLQSVRLSVLLFASSTCVCKASSRFF